MRATTARTTRSCRGCARSAIRFRPPSQSSGIGTIIRGSVSAGGTPNLPGSALLTGGADPRREGIVLGDTFAR